MRKPQFYESGKRPMEVPVVCGLFTFSLSECGLVNSFHGTHFRGPISLLSDNRWYPWIMLAWYPQYHGLPFRHRGQDNMVEIYIYFADGNFKCILVAYFAIWFEIHRTALFSFTIRRMVSVSALTQLMPDSLALGMISCNLSYLILEYILLVYILRICQEVVMWWTTP